MDMVQPEEVESGEFDADGKPIMKTEYRTVEETINSMIPIWQRPKDEVDVEESNEFYKNLYYDYADPVATIRVNAEGTLEYKAMLFIPGRAPSNFFSDQFEPGLQLYSNGVMVMERCKDVIPDCFRFVRGIVDSPDFSLNISRETLQHGRQLKTISNNLEKKVKNELLRLMEEEPEAYEQFYGAFSDQLKYSICNNYGEKKDLLVDLLMFYSSTEKELIPLKEYKSKMPEEQKLIYFVCTDSIDQAESLPQAEQVRDKGYEILYMTGEIDDFVVRELKEYDGMSFCNITTDDLGFEGVESKEEAEKKQEENKELLEFVKESVGEALSSVRISSKLKTSPVFLTTDGDVTIEMEKYFSMMKNNPVAQNVKASRVLELNAEHPAFAALKSAYDSDKDKAAELSKILYAQALLIAGLPLDNPTEYTELICKLF